MNMSKIKTAGDLYYMLINSRNSPEDDIKLLIKYVRQREREAVLSLHNSLLDSHDTYTTISEFLNENYPEIDKPIGGK